MRRIKHLILAIVTASLSIMPAFTSLPRVEADTTSSPSLVVSQLKITSSNGQFITLYNTTASTIDMTKYQLEYFNNYDLTKATSSKLISLSGDLPAHSYYMVNDDSLLLCYQLTIDSVSLGLSSTAGLIEILELNQSGPGAAPTPALGDYVGWSKTAATGAQTLPISTNAFLQRQPLDTQGNPSVAVPGGGSWLAVQPDPTQPCGLVSATGPSQAVTTGLNQLLPSSEPPATIVSSDENNDQDAAPAPALPLADVGLKAPTITEILPNPAGTGNDATDEFIEIYNSNTTTFDLSGFGLQAGTSSLHNFSFPSGISLPAQSFTAFYSADTGLSLSNSGGQVMLLDPFGNSLSSTDVYGTAADGQAWALANGKWYWTTTPTPNSANVINQSQTTKKSTKTSNKSKSSKVVTAKSSKGSSSAGLSKSSNGQSDTAAKVPIHGWMLALAAGLALLYGAYEYRTDLANRIHQLRVDYSARRSGRL